MSGVEIRLRYGDNRTGAKLQLSFDHIPDARAQEFLSHYAEVQGTFRSFVLPSSATTGWSGGALSPGTATTAAYRYSQPPQVTNIRPGVSSVSVELLGVM
ncbi:MAG: hypothetical protein LW834_12080 [Cyanobium sp. 49614_E6]|jgi:hypothetical protein|nr:hypothetical protein [Cyanobium sp. 49614_E6]MCE2837680.1 hypothetical protein [Cyanobium sp. 49614_E6]